MNATDWICLRCNELQEYPKTHPSELRCDPCRVEAKKEQTRAWQKANLAQFRNARPDLAMERRRGR